MSELLDEKFKNVKKTPGVQIWRIEKLEMKEDFHFSIMKTDYRLLNLPGDHDPGRDQQHKNGVITS